MASSLAGNAVISPLLIKVVDTLISQAQWEQSDTAWAEPDEILHAKANSSNCLLFN